MRLAAIEEPVAEKEPAAKKEPVAAVKKDTVQASCRRRPSPPLFACHILCSACNQTYPLSNILRSKAPGSWWRRKRSANKPSRRTDDESVTRYLSRPSLPISARTIFDPAHLDTYRAPIHTSLHLFPSQIHNKTL